MESTSNSSEYIASIPDLKRISQVFQLESEAIQYLRILECWHQQLPVVIAISR